MSDAAKRAALTSLVPKRPEEKRPREKRKTHRFALTLQESNERTCSEFNYRDLLNSAEKKEKANGKDLPVNGFDPFDEGDDDVRRIAKQFEQKYGCGPVGKKRKLRKDDYADIGAGYDESDSFIDNTDAYDEMVPADVTTLHGGFYINSGALEFKVINNSDDEVSPMKSAASRKRVIEDSSESSEDEDAKNEKTDKVKADVDVVVKNLNASKNGVHKQLKKKHKFINKDMKKKKSDALKNKALVEIMKKKRQALELTVRDDIEENLSPKHAIKNVGSPGEIRKEIEIKDSSASDDESSDSSASGSSSEQVQSSPQRNMEKKELEFIPLPENLSPKILELINSIKKASETSEGKVKFFSGTVNKDLLNLEILMKTLPKSKKMRIYDHLGTFVKCKRDTFIRRAKNLQVEDCKRKLKDLVIRMKSYVNGVMPELLENHQAECRKTLSLKFGKHDELNGDDKPVRFPRKKFLWSESSKKILRDIVHLCQRCHQLERKRKESFDIYLETFLRNELLPLWSDNWVTFNSLLNQCKPYFQSSEKHKPSPVPVAAPQTQSPASVSSSCSVSAATSSLMKTINSGSSGLTVTPVTTAFAKPTLAPPPLPQPPLPSVAAAVAKTESSNSAKFGELSISINPKQPDKNASFPVDKLSPRIVISPKSSTAVSITTIEPRLVEAKEEPQKEVAALIMKPTHAALIDKIPTSTPSYTTTKPVSLKQRILDSNEKPKEKISDYPIIDLTDSDFSRKPGPKSKTKYIDAKFFKGKSSVELEKAATPPKYDATSINRVDSFSQRRPEEITGTAALNQIISESLTGFPARQKTPIPAASSFSADSIIKPNDSYSRAKADQHGSDDVMEQVMQNLKELEQMSQPKKSAATVSPSSPVSVIAFNSSYSPSKVVPEKKSDPLSGYGDVYRKPQHYSDTPPNVFSAASTKQHNFNNADFYQYPRGSAAASTTESMAYQQKYLQNMNASNPYYANVKNMTTSQLGTNTLNNDYSMYQNYYYEYGYPKSSGSKPQ